MSTLEELKPGTVTIEVGYSTVSDEMRMLMGIHQVEDDPFILGALMALSWIRDGSRRPTEIYRQGSLSS